MRASKRGRERRSSQSVEVREGLVGGVGQRVPVMDTVSLKAQKDTWGGGVVRG